MQLLIIIRYHNDHNAKLKPMGERGKTHAWRNAHHVSISRRLCFFIPDDESPADAAMWKPKGRAPSGEICKNVAQKGSCDESHWSCCCEWVLMLDKAHKGTHRNVLFLEKQTITFGKWTACSECAWQQTVDWGFLASKPGNFQAAAIDALAEEATGNQERPCDRCRECNVNLQYRCCWFYQVHQSLTD